MISFAHIDSALPDELADMVARYVHRSAYAPVMEQLLLQANVLDCAIELGVDDISGFLRASGAREVRDETAYWLTVAFFLSEHKKHFVLVHEFIEGPYDNYKLIMEGAVNGDQVSIKRMYHIGTGYVDVSYPLQLVTGTQYPGVNNSCDPPTEWMHSDAIIQKFRPEA
jgi:hypothetical protein